jgi:signal transduction histidine kinase/ActR/RegA family two-component response regulator
MISLVNSEFEQLVGLPRSGIEGRLKCSDMFGASEFNRLKTYIFTDIGTGGDFSNNLELQFLSKEGFKKNVLCKIGHIPKTEKSILSMLDVTEMRRAEEEKSKLKSKLARSEKMEALGLLAGGVAHDLNNVLSGIVSYPDLLLIDLPEDSPFRKPIKTIQDSGTKAAAIVQDLLTLSRRDVVVKEVVNINDVIQDYLQSPEYEKMLSFHPGVTVHFTGDKELFNIDGVPLNLNKVIMNLVTNAAEATKDGGRITISTENCYLYDKIPGFDQFQEGNHVIVSVADSGIGIDKKDMERIFEPFYSKKVMGRSGTGLGMTVVWGTVHDHNGHIEVNSTLGKGTTFKMLFPATAKALQKNAPSISIDDLMGKGESILVVDDVKEQRDLASGILSRLRYKVQVASSGEEAVALVKKGGDFDLVILDMLMHPGMDGLETYRQLLKIKSTQHAIIASGFSETNRVKEAQNIGAGRYVRKPYTLTSIGFAVKDEIKIYKESIHCFQ